MDRTKEIEIFRKGKYVIVDPLYLDQIRYSIENIDNICEGLDLLYQLESEVFPYSGGYILGYLDIKKDNSMISVMDFKKSKPEDLPDPQNKDRFCLFTTDSGIVIICEIHSLLKLSEYVDYDLLVNEEGIDEGYLENLKTQSSENNLWILSTPGINHNIDFDGSGVYSCVTLINHDA